MPRVRRPDSPSPYASPRAGAEWLLTDGAGGYGCGTIEDLPRRRYHGLWIVRPEGTARRRLLVAGFDERIVRGDDSVSLMHAHWHGLPSPSAPPVGVQFARDPLPTWTFEHDGRRLERTVALQRQTATSPPRLLLRWRNLAAVPFRLAARPLFGWCDADHLPPVDESFDATVQTRGASWGVRPNALLPTAWLTVDGVAAFRGEPAWYRGFYFAEDAARGYDHVGQRWSPGVLEIDLPAGGDAVLAVTMGEACDDAAGAFASVEAEAERVLVALPAASADPLALLQARLASRVDDFLYRTDEGRLGVLAGFPWFGEWGRDVFLSLPGLTISCGRAGTCRDVMLGALPFLRDGLLPNIYGATVADSHYDSCDAALWFALAVQRYADGGGDATLLREQLLPALVQIAEAYQRGTHLGLAVDDEGLLRAGRDDLNATWMDARIGSVPVTPRAGLPVEIQAVWYSLLAFLGEHDGQRWHAARDRCGAAFVRRFWLADDKYLADRVCDGVADRCVRPNMLVAAALARSPLTTAQRAGVVKKAQSELETPRGLRTLSPHDPAYCPRYEGGIESRDRAYHQGTVWPWLAGFYVEAALRAANKRTLPKERARLAQWLAGFLPELDRAGLDHVSEVFDGDEPQRPGGTFAQAWNTGELLRALRLVAEGA